ncbi:hypothetical protein B0H13DRAFT_2347249 [Mycena leptocephala]|nr:hypothetical protein B0H13DRAFT_2347249 [Mycena leptocephala]
MESWGAAWLKGTQFADLDMPPNNELFDKVAATARAAKSPLLQRRLELKEQTAAKNIPAAPQVDFNFPAELANLLRPAAVPAPAAPDAFMPPLKTANMLIPHPRIPGPDLSIENFCTLYDLDSDICDRFKEHNPPSSNLSSSSQAQTSQLSHNFPPAFLASANGVPDCLIDLRLLPLPEDNDSDFDPPAVAKLRGLKPATKVAGVCQKDKKGKKRARSSDSDCDDSDAAPAPKQGGRPKGSTNFNGRDVDKLLDITDTLLPLAAKGWKNVTRDHNTWAEKHDRPLRDAKSLEAKIKKPTSDPDCAPEVKRAKLIDRKINERVGTRDLGDSEFGGNISSEDSVEVLESRGKKLHSAIARRAPTPPLPRKSRPELVSDARGARATSHAHRTPLLRASCLAATFDDHYG